MTMAVEWLCGDCAVISYGASGYVVLVYGFVLWSSQGEGRKGEGRKREERKGKGRKGKERKGKERKGEGRKGKERKGKGI